MRSVPSVSNHSRLGPSAIIVLAGAAIAVSASGPLAAQQPSPAPAPASSPESIQQHQPPFFVHAEVDRRSAEYYEGEQIALSVVCEQDAFLYVLYKQADGQVYAVFPNSAQPDNRVLARKKITVPAESDAFRWTVSAPFGKELMKVIASKARIAELERPEARRQRFSRVSRESLAGVVRAVNETLPADRWSEVALEIVTHAGPNPNAAPDRKRFGVFVGVSAQDLTALKVAAFGDKANNDLGNCAIDAAILGSCMEKIGGLEASKVFVGKDASRKNLESSVVEWLPSVSHPGDTVVIYFSGHGTQAADDNGDEADGRDEFLIPCDTIDVDSLMARSKLKQENKPIDADANRRVEVGWKLLERAGIRTIKQSNAEQANSVLLRATAVSDDLFGRWLQALAGRRVIVILDSCFSGGFASQEKGLTKSELSGDAPAGFDFLDGEIGRLKDIGQPDTALLTACRAFQTALNSHANSGKADEQEPASVALNVLFQNLNLQKPADKDPMGVMTYFLLNALLTAPGPLSVDQAGAECAREMKAYFASETFREFVRKVNQQRVQAGLAPVELKGHEPTYRDYCRPPALLKP